jgi:hypothetical protein
MLSGFALPVMLNLERLSDLVNSPGTDDTRCIEPVRIDRDFFERQWWGACEDWERRLTRRVQDGGLIGG